MIRVRRSDGTVVEVEKASAIEIVDDQGRLAVAITQSPNGAVHVLTPGDPVFTAYRRASRMSESSVTVHEPFAGRPMPMKR